MIFCNLSYCAPLVITTSYYVDKNDFNVKTEVIETEMKQV